MAVYVIGDLQGCYQSLMQLLQKIEFREHKDQLWFCGDIVNRGPDSLQCLEFVRSMGDEAVMVLGNHDLHLLAVAFGDARLKAKDTLSELVQNPQHQELLHWLRKQPLMHFNADYNALMVHAGVTPQWRLSDAQACAAEVEQTLRGDNYQDYFRNMYGNEPEVWDDALQGMERLRCITNIFTRMRYCDAEGVMDFDNKMSPASITGSSIRPWFEQGSRLLRHNRVFFGHWSTLPSGKYGKAHALDSGCLWGGSLTAVRIDKKQPRWYRVQCPPAIQVEDFLKSQTP